MCNLYRLSKSSAEVARLFGAADDSAGSNAGEFIYPGYPGMVVADGSLRTMAWGFPLVLKGKHGQPLKPKPVNNTRSDKLDSGFWRASFHHRRCLIPLTAFAEAEGPRGGKTRTWIALPGHDVFCCAGIWRDSDEWGPVYSMVITEPSEQMHAVHSRMPVILPPSAHHTWVEGEPAEARALCVPYPGPLSIKQTDQPWSGHHA
ncbi:MAG: SOS response-associated peptidase family protein [Novosphingobium sp.]|nr:SOS response-associated peptidase family protein [Novosphingobium sp.]